MKKYILLFLLIISPSALAYNYGGYENYVYDPNDFATEWIEYNPKGIFEDWLSPGNYLNNPDNVLGRPTVDTTGDDWAIPEDQPVPVNPVYPAFRYYELLFLGEGGYVTVQFDHDVRDDENNPYGIDLIVYGNTMQIIGGGMSWTNGDPGNTTVVPNGNYEPGIVSVSQDGVIWYSFTNDPDFMSDDPNFIKLPAEDQDGPFCDSFAPTLGRVYTDDPSLAEPCVGSWNQWWAEPTNPTFPVNHDLWFSSFEYYTIAQICQVYGNSAGGTGYDINRLSLPVDPMTGKKWLRYVRVDDKAQGGSAEIDAFADVSCCGDWKHPYPQSDLNKDCRVNLLDLAVMGDFWLDHIYLPDEPAKIADLESDETVNLKDLSILVNNWLDCTWDCN